MKVAFSQHWSQHVAGGGAGRALRKAYFDLAFEIRIKQMIAAETANAAIAANPALRTAPRTLWKSSSSVGRPAYFVHHRRVHGGNGEETTRTSAQTPKTMFWNPTWTTMRPDRSMPNTVPAGRQNAINAAFRR